jgi:hypothetical protein
MMLTMLMAAQAAAAMLPAQGVPPTDAGAATHITVPQDTPVELMATSEVNTDDAQPGLIFKLRVNKPVVIDGRTVIPVGTPAFGEVTSATDAGGLGKSGRMTARLLNIRHAGVELPLEGQMNAKGRGAGSAGVAVIFTGVMGLFHRGNNAKIKAGEIISGFVAKDVEVPEPAPIAASVAP